MVTNTLFYGDNLPILREYVSDESVDLVYLDPPFNSNRNYNVLFRDESGEHSEAQIEAFEDTWHWGPEAAETYHELVTEASDEVSRAVAALRDLIGTNQVMAYLVMMTARLVELHRVLKPTGSLYLHCDSTASHYLKVVLDTIFDPRQFRNQITWKRTHAHGDSKRRFANISDSILFYSKNTKYTFNPQYIPYSQNYVDKYYRQVDSEGRRYQLVSLRSPNFRPNLVYDYKGYKPHPNGWALSRVKMEELDSQGRLHFPKKPDGAIREKYFLDEMPGVVSGDNWTDILPISAHASERLGYPTQKPLALLERIINASSNPGDTVLDPFCGCGTAIAAAQKLGRNWIGIDVTHLSIALQKYRMEDMFPGIEMEVRGEPEDLGSARQLAQDDPYQFQWWALSLVRAKPLGAKSGGKVGKKGADKGVDGIVRFVDDASGKPKQVIVQVKSGKVESKDIRDLVGTVQRREAALGVFITLRKPTPPMNNEALSAGFYESPGWHTSYPKIQILTIEQLLAGEQIKMPPQHGTFKEARRSRRDTEEHPTLGL